MTITVLMSCDNITTKERVAMYVRLQLKIKFIFMTVAPRTKLNNAQGICCDRVCSLAMAY